MDAPSSRAESEAPKATKPQVAAASLCNLQVKTLYPMTHRDARRSKSRNKIEHEMVAGLGKLTDGRKTPPAPRKEDGTLEESASLAFERIAAHLDRQDTEMPRKFAAFRGSPLMALWLQSVVDYFKDDQTQRQLMDVSVAYCQIVLACSNTASPTRDRLFFTLLFRLTLAVLEDLMPSDLPDVQPELFRLITALQEINICSAKQPALGNQTVQERPTTAASQQEGEPSISDGDVLTQSVATVNVVERESLETPSLLKTGSLRERATRNVEASQRFVEAAATRFLKRREARRARRSGGLCTRERLRKLSPLVSNVLTAISDETCDDGLRQAVATNAVRGIFKMSCVSGASATRPSPRAKRHTLFKSSAIAAPAASGNGGESPSGGASVLTRHHTPKRPSVPRGPQDFATRMSQARTSFKLLDQRLDGLIEQQSKGDPPLTEDELLLHRTSSPRGSSPSGTNGRGSPRRSSAGRPRASLLF